MNEYLWKKWIKLEVLESRNQFLLGKLFGIHNFLTIKKLVIQTQTVNSGMLPNKPAFVILSFVSTSDYTKLLHYQPFFLKTSVFEWVRKLFSGHMDDAEDKVSHTTPPRTFPTCTGWHCCSLQPLALIIPNCPALATTRRAYTPAL